MDDLTLARRIAEEVASLGGRAFFVGGCVRDELTNTPCKDIDIEVYHISPAELRSALGKLGEVYEKGAAFGVLSLRHTNLDIAMPRKESRTGARHRDFDVSVDPYLSYEDASKRRDFTINAMMRDILTGELIDVYGGADDLKNRIVRHVSDETFADDALRVFRAAQFAARLGATVAPETAEICRKIDVTQLSNERVYEELSKALLKAEKPSVFFTFLRGINKLEPFFHEVNDLIGVEQNPEFHPEGDVFVHTMLVLDAAAKLRDQAAEPLNFMLAALCHDLGKYNASEVINGRITSHMHHVTGVPLAEKQLGRLTNNRRTTEYVKNMVKNHMRPNVQAANDSKRSKSRAMFDESACPRDLILLAKADALGSTGTRYDEKLNAWLNDRLNDYNEILARPMALGRDFVAAGIEPGPAINKMVRRARTLHFAGVERDRAVKQVLSEFADGRARTRPTDKKG